MRFQHRLTNAETFRQTAALQTCFLPHSSGIVSDVMGLTEPNKIQRMKEDMGLKTVPEKLAALRTLMRDNKTDAYVVMSADPHMSEYLPAYWQVRLWLTGFTGSVGTLVVTQDFAGLWVDGRYWVQAEKELAGTGFVLQKLTQEEHSTHVAWLAKNLPQDAVVGVDGRALSIAQYQSLSLALAQKNVRIDTEQDLISPIWQNRPDLPMRVVHPMANGLNSLSRAEKLHAIRGAMQERGLSHHFVSSVDDVAWILNCRGSDVECNPVFLAHLYIGFAGCVLFVQAAKIDADLKKAFAADGISLQDYADSGDYLRQLSTGGILMDAAKVSVAHLLALPAQTSHSPSTVPVIYDINPSSLLKACKSDSEIAHVKNAMRKDGVALAHFFAWLEQALEYKDDITELTIAEKLLEYRSQQLGFIGESFATIAGFNENGALPHYHATQQSFAKIEGNGLLLIDSGGQYEEGTTDITRMVAIGELTAAQKRDCTLVLKAHIALAQAVFPEGIAAPLLDALARQALWQQQLDYRHGTGHGVGFALNVHEGPQILSYYAPCSAYNKMRAGMITSNEPGLYHEGQYGIRIENLVVNRLLPQTGAYGDFLAFENLTLCPIATQCLDVTMLTANEKNWLNAYHLQVRAALAGELSGAALDWLLRQTEAVA